jgi:hypothetical protein
MVVAFHHFLVPGHVHYYGPLPDRDSLILLVEPHMLKGFTFDYSIVDQISSIILYIQDICIFAEKYAGNFFRCPFITIEGECSVKIFYGSG